MTTTNGSEGAGTADGATDIDFFVDERREGEAEVSLSPSGRYRLTVQRYRTRSGGWSYSRGTVTRSTDESDRPAVVCDIKRNFPVFHHSFVVKDGREYLIAGSSYWEPTVVDLDGGVELVFPSEEGAGGFCWATCALSPDGNTLAVDGCIWANPYEMRFFDFTDPTKGWPPLRIVGSERLECPSDTHPSHWLDATTFECLLCEDQKTKLPHERARLERRGGEMVVIDSWISEEERLEREQRERAEADQDRWWGEFRQTSALYARLAELVEEHQLSCFTLEPRPFNYRVDFRFRGGDKRHAPPELRLDDGAKAVTVSFFDTPREQVEVEYSVAGVEAAVALLVKRRSQGRDD